MIGEDKTWMYGENYNLMYKNRDKRDVFVSGWSKYIERDHKISLSIDLHKLVLLFHGWWDV